MSRTIEKHERASKLRATDHRSAKTPSAATERIGLNSGTTSSEVVRLAAMFSSLTNRFTLESDPQHRRKNEFERLIAKRVHMITVSFVSPAAVIYNVNQTAEVITGTVPNDIAAKSGMHLFGVIIAGSIPLALMQSQRDQTVETSVWRLIVSDGKNTYEFTKVWFSAHDYPASGEIGKVRIDFGSQTGPPSLKLVTPQ